MRAKSPALAGAFEYQAVIAAFDGGEGARPPRDFEDAQRNEPSPEAHGET